MERSSQSADIWEGTDPPLAFAQDQLAWYTRNNRNARIGHYSIEISSSSPRAATTLAAAIGAIPW